MGESIDDPGPGIFVLTDLLINAVSPTGVIGIVILILLLILSALISGSEVAFFSLSTEDINKCRISDQTAEKHLVALLENPKKLLATILIMNNLVNIAFVIISTFLTWHHFGNERSDNLLVLMLTVVNTFLIVLFGEIIPKVYANQNNLNFAKTFIVNYDCTVQPI